MNFQNNYAILLLFLPLFFLLSMCSKTPGVNNKNGDDVLQLSGSSSCESLSSDKQGFSAASPPGASTPLPEELKNELTIEELKKQFPTALTDKATVAAWIQNNFTRYFQKYNLSCEAAIIRMVTGIWGINDLGEDSILEMMPLHPGDPELGLVMEDITGDVHFPDGSINWGNYGAHPPVVKETLDHILEMKGLDRLYRIDQKKLDNKQLINLLKTDTECLGAIIWVAAYIDKEKPPVNEMGQVLGEHVQFVSPLLSKGGRMLVYDVWPWDNQPFHLYVPFNRDMFDYETLLIMKKK